jgi:MarR family 2-MHQ and catechol resistance regulon transcriptional repressor
MAKTTVAKTEANELDTTGPRLWLVLARAYGSLATYVEHCIAAEGLCLSDFMVLEVLLHKGPLAISTIGEKVLLANASMTAAVDRLEKRGLVARHASGEDRRSKLVALTREGKGFITELYARHVRDIEAVTSSLSAAENAGAGGSRRYRGAGATSHGSGEAVENAQAGPRPRVRT